MKLGIVGSGLIVTMLFDALKEIEKDFGEDKISVKAICVRPQSEEKGRKLQEEQRINNLYTDYEGFLKDSDFDFVYIGIVNSLHYKYAKQALEAGYNVILEKPFVDTVAEARELVDIAKKKNLYLFEAISVIHFPNFRYVQKKLKDIGEIKVVQCNYSQYSSRYDAYRKGIVKPAFDPDLKGGALRDINIYNLHVITALFGKPQNAYYQANYGFNGVDTSGCALLVYPDFTVVSTGAKDSASPSFILIQGTKGYIRINGPTNHMDSVNIGDLKLKEIHFRENEYKSHLVYEFLDFERIYKEQDMATCIAWMEQSVLTMEVLEALERNKIVLMSEDDRNAIQERLYPEYIPEVAESIVAGGNTSVEDCLSEDEVDW
jgi:scyllo-inositol 2-dehydrogenase (NADP+)